MAEKRPDTIDPHAASGGTDSNAIAGNPNLGNSALQSVSNRRHVILPFITENVDDADTYTLDDGSTYVAPDSTIVRAAWEPDGAADNVGALVDVTGKVVTFHVENANSNGYLHLWMNY